MTQRLRFLAGAPRIVKDLDEGAAGRACHCSCLSRSKYVNRAWPAFRRVSGGLFADAAEMTYHPSPNLSLYLLKIQRYNFQNESQTYVTNLFQHFTQDQRHHRSVRSSYNVIFRQKDTRAAVAFNFKWVLNQVMKIQYCRWYLIHCFYLRKCFTRSIKTDMLHF